MKTVNSVVCYGVEGKALECLASACRSTGFELYIADGLMEALEESPLLVVVDPSSAD